MIGGTERLERDEDVCALVQDLLPLYLDDEVNSRSRAMIVAHLNECSHCAGFLAGARSARAQFEREREREREHGPGAIPISIFTMLISLLVGALGLVISMIFIYGGLNTFINTPYSTWITPIPGGITIHTVYSVFCLIALVVISVQLVQPNRKRNTLALISSIGGALVGVAAVIIPHYELAYTIIGVTLLVASLTYLWQEHEQISKLSWQDVMLRGGGLMLVGVGVLAMILVVAPNRPSWGSTAELAPTAVPPGWLSPAEVIPSSIPTSTPVGALSQAYPVQIQVEVAVTPTPVSAP